MSEQDGLYGLTVHKHSYEAIVYPSYETHDTLVDMAIELSRECNVPSLAPEIDSITTELEKLKEVYFQHDTLMLASL
jgi:hypothetical protein